MSLVLRNKGKGMQRSSEQPLVGEERYVTTLITAAKETRNPLAKIFFGRRPQIATRPVWLKELLFVGRRLSLKRFVGD